MPDPSFHPEALMGSTAWTARRLGVSKDWFFRHRDKMVTAGFPKPDPLTKLYIKADVDEWVQKRRQSAPGPGRTMQAPKQEVNADAL